MVRVGVEELSLELSKLMKKEFWRVKNSLVLLFSHELF